MFIEADDEEAARAQAKDMGMAVEEVEAVQPRVERAVLRTPGEQRSLVRWFHRLVTIALGGVLLILGVLLAAGKVEIRPVKQGDTRAPPDPRIEWMEDPDTVFDLLGDKEKPFCFKYEGTWIDCWIEVEVDGKTTRLAEVRGDDLRWHAELGRDTGEKDREPAEKEAAGQPAS